MTIEYPGRARARTAAPLIGTALGLALGIGAFGAPALRAATVAPGGLRSADVWQERQEQQEQERREQQEAAEQAAYREAREAVGRGRFEQASELFARLRELYPRSRYDAESMYWQAFSLYRLEHLREALAVLESQLDQYPMARITEDSRDLELRIRSLLGQRGDAQAAQRALREAEVALAAVAGGQQETERTMRLAEEAIAASQARAGESLDRQRELVEAQQAQQARLASEMAQMMERSAADRDAMAMEIAAARAAGQTGVQEACADDVRHAAIQAVMQMEPERAIPLLRGVLEQRDECAAPLREQAVFVLGQQDAAAVEDLMIDVARNDPDPGVQEAAVFWLSQVGSEHTAAVLADILESTDNAVLQENAIFALSQHSSERAAEILRSYALDASRPERVREKAIFWLTQNPEYADPGFLMALYEQLDSSALKEHVFIQLSQLNDPDAANWVLDRALDTSEDPDVRRQALFWAGQQPSLDLRRLEGLYEHLPDRGMREQLIYLYAQRQEPERVDRLIEIARVEKDPELRKAVIFWLGQTGDQRAVDYLLELLERPPEEPL